MQNKNILLLFMLVSINAFCQDKSILLYGKIETDSSSTENIHIVNKSTKKGAITTALGTFKIYVKKQDTLLISAIQFEHKVVVITQKEIDTQKIILKLSAKMNQLDEVQLKQHDLSGYLHKDIENAPLINHVDEFTLKLPNSGKAPKTELDFINLRHAQYKGVANALYGWISGEKKKLKKLEKLEKEKLVLQKIRILISDAYFIQALQIKKENIDGFLTYCKPFGIIRLYKENNILKVIDIVIKESKTFKQ